MALDGSKVKANASKYKAMSYKRMGEKQRQLRNEVKQLLAQAEAVDAATVSTLWLVSRHWLDAGAIYGFGAASSR